ncbi:alpha/beta hydrolase [Balneolaceae bacterium YR4-1]|uniref:Alpha/beta hydrolase n=1 Tax=Halalkalibaculum roseum TaxID=2709311 RepID=A0A6M1T6Q5_9BACT|nr:alpha/beta hydrolase [Halalkalibaculum roseum]NGP77635.1 alpha/beta hydrolase [Halalkalibaculum roseum]
MTDKRTYRYNNLPVAYRKTGTGKPMIILHGWGSSSRVMMPVAKQLSDIRCCYVIDLPGFGDTPEPDRSWSIDDYTDMVQSFIENECDETVDILAHSFGGRITLKLCARAFGQEWVEKVLITGGAGMKPRRKPSYYLKKYTAKLLKAPFLLLPSGSKENALKWLRNTSAWKALGSSEYSELSGVMRETFVKSVTEYLEATLPKIPHEVLLLWGRNDEATPIYQGERMDEGIQNAALVVMENAGHYAFLDKPKHFTSIARAFLKD